MTREDDVMACQAHSAVVFTIRSAEPGDACTLRSLTREAYARRAAVLGREPAPMTADYDESVRNHLIDLLYANGDCVGFVEMIPQPDHLLIYNVAVAPVAQGRGFGRRMLLHAENVAAGLGLSEVRLYTNKIFKDNIDLYLRIGYCVCRDECFLGGIRVHMRKSVELAAN